MEISSFTPDPVFPTEVIEPVETKEVPNLVDTPDGPLDLNGFTDIEREDVESYIACVEQGLDIYMVTKEKDPAEELKKAQAILKEK